MANLYLSDNQPAGAPDEPDVFRLPRPPREETDLDITPMIDVTFLLLIFFIVAARLDPSTAVDLPHAKHGAAVPEKESVLLIVARGEDESARVFLGGAKDAANEVRGDAADQETKIAEYVEDELNGSPPKKHVLIKAERGIHFRYVDEVRRAASKGMDVQQHSMHVGILEQK